MADVWGALGALVVFVLPMALAGWLLRRHDRHRHGSNGQPHGKMPDRKEGDPC